MYISFFLLRNIKKKIILQLFKSINHFEMVYDHDQNLQNISNDLNTTIHLVYLKFKKTFKERIKWTPKTFLINFSSKKCYFSWPWMELILAQHVARPKLKPTIILHDLFRLFLLRSLVIFVNTIKNSNWFRIVAIFKVTDKT